jgi:hypothetical protein
MFNKLAIQSLVASAVFGLALAFSASSAVAGPPCVKNCEPPPKCNPEKEQCICHNIGGPRDLGANCDFPGVCLFTTDTGRVVAVGSDEFLGIIIGFNQDSNALVAHLNHGDGPILERFVPALHLASIGLNHEASNVECRGFRFFGEDPGN